MGNGEGYRAVITIIGRGHSGTRAISQTLYSSGVFMGQTLNPSADLVPPEAMYDACRVFAKYVKWNGDLSWDFSQVIDMDIPDKFIRLLNIYLATVINSDEEPKGWKIPETTLVYPWIVRLFPEAHYIFWIRNPRDCILGHHVTDDMRQFGIEYPPTSDERRRRAISWKYQYDLVRATPKPKKWLEVRFEDFVLDQENTLKSLEDFLGFPLARIVVRPETLNRWKTDTGQNYFDFFEPAMREYQYEIPEKA
jgi:hypothetical protein